MIPAEIVAFARRLPMWLVGGLLLLVVCAFAAWNHSRLVDQRDAALREQGAAELREKGLIVKHDASESGLKAELEALRKGNSELDAALREALAKAPQTKVVTVERLVTKEVPTLLVPRPVVPGSTPQYVLAAGDRTRIEVARVELQTKDGNLIVVGTASAWRVTPTEAKLMEAPFSASVSRTSGLTSAAAVPPAGFGVGLYGAFGPHGYLVGPAVALPPLLGRVESQLGLGLGPTGEWQAAGSAVFRFR